MQNLSKLQINHYLALNCLRSELGGSIESYVSYCGKSIPTSGSRTYSLSDMDESEVFKTLLSVRKHKNGDITLFTSNGNIRLWRSEDDKQYEQCLRQGPILMKKLWNK